MLDQMEQHIGAMGVIFAISLLGTFLANSREIELTSALAVSFPAISKKIRFLTIPKILFFIGKHFGTGKLALLVAKLELYLPKLIAGVILSTAFCHLLQDSFEALTSNIVKSRYPGVGEQTGFIMFVVLNPLLRSTTYVLVI